VTFELVRQKKVGDFGFFSPSYAITGERIRIARKAWLLGLGALAPLGVWSVIHAFTRASTHLDRSDRLTGKLFIVWGFLLLAIGGRALWEALSPPRAVEFSRGGVRWGSRELTDADIDDVRLELRIVRQGAFLHHHWFLVLETKGTRWLEMKLCHKLSNSPPAALFETLQAIRELLGIKRAAA
jgi:hypothetical protein